MGAAEAAATQPVPIDLALRSTVDSVSSIVRTLAQRSDETQAKIDEQAATLATLQQNAEVTSKLVKAALTTRTST